MHRHADIAHQVMVRQHCVIFDIAQLDRAAIIDTGSGNPAVKLHIDRLQTEVSADLVDRKNDRTFKLKTTIGFHGEPHRYFANTLALM